MSADCWTLESWAEFNRRPPQPKAKRKYRIILAGTSVGTLTADWDEPIDTLTARVQAGFIGLVTLEVLS